MNRQEMQNLLDYTAKYPTTMNMETIVDLDDDAEWPDEPTIITEPGQCGTVACLAGNALFMKGRQFQVQTNGNVNIMDPRLGPRIEFDYIAEAAQILDLTCTWLFFEYDWPQHYQEMDADVHTRAVTLLADILSDNLVIDEDYLEKAAHFEL